MAQFLRKKSVQERREKVFYVYFGMKSLLKSGNVATIMNFLFVGSVTTKKALLLGLFISPQVPMSDPRHSDMGMNTLTLPFGPKSLKIFTK